MSDLPATETAYEIPASEAQRFVVLHSEQKPSAWNVAVRFRLHGFLEAADLETAINRVVDQHEILRTCFADVGGVIEQRIADSCFVPLAYFDVSAQGPESILAQVDLISVQEARRPFDLHSLPLMRAGLISTAPDEHILLLTMHHAICDGWSVGILAADIMRAYAAVCAGNPFRRDEAALQYADYAVTQNDYADTAEYRAHADFWKHEIASLAKQPAVQVQPPSNAGDEASIHSRLLPLDLTHAIEALARREQLTFFEVVLSAFALSRMLTTGRAQATFATPVSGRNSSETEAMVGSFVNYLPVHIAGNPATPLAAFRRSVADTVQQLQAHADYRTEELIADNSVSLAPFFDHVFICQRDFVSTVSGGGVELSAIPSVSPGALHAMTFFLVERADGWRASCEVDGSAHTSADACAVMDTFGQTLQAFIEQPDATVASILGPSHQPAVASHPATTEVFDLPSSEAQQRYWMLQQVQSDSSTLHLRIRLRIHGVFHAETARRALQLLVDRHETLRTTLIADGDNLFQRVHPIAAEPDFEVNDVSDRELHAAAVAAAEMLHREDTWQFDPERQSWLRALVLVLNPSETILAITLPHTLADGWSCGILLREFYASYDGLSRGVTPAFEALPVQYADAVVHEQQWLDNGAMQKRLDWWTGHLPAALAPASIPADKDNTAPAESGVAVFTLDPMMVAAVKQFAQDHSVTLFSAYGAALLGLLTRYTHQHSLSLVTPFANRNSETENTIGPFATPVLVHSAIPRDASFQDILNSFQQDAMASFENAISLERCIELTSLHSRLGRHAANQISFFYQNAFVAQTLADEFSATPMPAAATGAAFEWQFAVIDYGSDVRIEFLYDARLWSAASIRLCVEHYQRLLGECIFHPEMPIARIEIATEDERALEYSPERLLPISRRALNLTESAIDTASAPRVAPVAPRTDLERTLVSVWRQVFRSDTIGIQDDFFDLGGHSLILARIQAQLKRATGHRIVAADIFAAPTIAQLASRIDADGERQHQSRIFALQPAGSQPPLFLISQSMVFRCMVQWLHPDQPVYTVVMEEEDLRSAPRTTFEEIAAQYVSLIRSACPFGPYRLGGWCVSSWLAYEIAQQLRAAGDQVDLLLLVDGWAPGYWRRLGILRRMAAKSNYYRTRIVRHARALATATFPQRLAFLKQKWTLVQVATSQQLASLFYSAGVKAQVKVEEQLTLVDQLVFAASRHYTPQPYKFPALVFRSMEQPRGRLLPYDLGWGELLECPVDTIQLPGDHQEIFDDPGAQILAQHISDFLHLPPADSANPAGPGSSQDVASRGKRQQQPNSCALASV